MLKNLQKTTYFLSCLVDSLVIGNAFMSKRLKTHFDREWIYNPNVQTIQELVQFKKDVFNKQVVNS